MKTSISRHTRRSGRTGLSLLVALAVALISTLTFAPAANAAGTLTVSKRFPLTDGEVITVSGVGMAASATVTLTVCNAAQTKCDTDHSSTSATDAAGVLPDTAITVVGSWTNGSGAVDCRTADDCTLFVADGVDTVTKTLGFTPSTASLSLSKATGVKYNGEDITVTGSGFKPNVSLMLIQCPTGSQVGCGAPTMVTASGSGAFSQLVAVMAKPSAGVDCAWAPGGCVILTSRVGYGADSSQQVSTAIAFAKAGLAASKTADVNPDGESVSVSGANFAPATDLFLTLCDTTKPPGSACDMANFKQVTTDAAGSFSQAITLKATFGTAPNAVDCRTTTCALMTSKVGNGADYTQAAVLPIAFAALAPPHAALSASKTTGIVTTGETITVTGTFYKPAVTLFVTLCNTAVPNGGACDLANFKQVTTDGAGGFSTPIKLVSTFTSGSTTYDCLVVPCAIQTSRVGQGSDLTQQATLPVTFAVPAPAGAKLSASKTTGINAAGEQIQVSGTGFKSKVDLFVALCDPSVANGGSCDMGNFGQVTTDAAGAFTLPIKVLGKFTGAAGSVNCLVVKCALMTSRIGQGSDLTQQVSLPLAFAEGTLPIQAQVKLSKSKGLMSGAKVKVNGTRFAPTSTVKVALCKTSATVGTRCDNTRARKVTASASGSFKVGLKVRPTFGQGKSKVDCAKVKCSVKTWSAKRKNDSTQQTRKRVTFKQQANRVVISGRAMAASLRLSRTTFPRAGSTTISVRGSGYKPGVSLYVVTCNLRVAKGGACDMSRFRSVKTSRTGTFSTSMSIAGVFSSAAGKVNCAKVPCGVQTSRVGMGSDLSQQRTVRLTFV